MKCQQHLPCRYSTQSWLKQGFYHWAQDSSWGEEEKEGKRGGLKLQFLESNDCGRLSIELKKEKKKNNMFLAFLNAEEKKKKTTQKNKILKAQNHKAENETPEHVLYL